MKNMTHGSATISSTFDQLGINFSTTSCRVYTNAHSDQGVAGNTRKTHISGQRYSRPRVGVQEALVSLALGSCSISLSSHKDDMTVLQMWGV